MYGYEDLLAAAGAPENSLGLERSLAAMTAIQDALQGFLTSDVETARGGGS